VPQSFQSADGVLSLAPAVTLLLSLSLHFLEPQALGCMPVAVGQALLGNAGDFENEDPLFTHLPGHGWPLILTGTLNLGGGNGNVFTRGGLNSCGPNR
jgi:hypothetical protein